MIDTTMTVSLRGQRQRDRMERVLVPARTPPSVRVVPRDDDMRRALKHFPSGVGFPKEGGATWPLDRFTKRRIQDGTVTREEREQEPKEEHEQRRHSRRGSPTSSEGGDAA